MRTKLFILIPLLITGYGFFPVNIRFTNPDLTKPNTLIIHHQECGCPCPDASIIQGRLIIPDSIQKSYGNIHKNQINITGNDPLDPYEYELSARDFIITGKVVGVDTVLCDPTNCEVVPVFEVERWSIDSYYPRFWGFNKAFFMLFLFSLPASAIGFLVLVFRGVKKMWRRKEKDAKQSR